MNINDTRFMSQIEKQKLFLSLQRQQKNRFVLANYLWQLLVSSDIQGIRKAFSMIPDDDSD